MSKLLTAENLLSAFPIKDDERITVCASVIAQEFMELYEDNDILAIYARIDELDEPLLDILAYDFKIDWWNKSFSLDEKRETMKACWRVRRKLGVPGAINLSLSAFYNNAEVKEWWEYGGNPFYYKLHIDSGEVLPDADKLEQAVAGAKYYKNTRSILQGVEVDVKKKFKTYIGMALQVGVSVRMKVPAVDLSKDIWLLDENGSILVDENGSVLLD